MEIENDPNSPLLKYPDCIMIPILGAPSFIFCSFITRELMPLSVVQTVVPGINCMMDRADSFLDRQKFL